MRNIGAKDVEVESASSFESEEPVIPLNLLEDREYFNLMNIIGLLPNLQELKDLPAHEIKAKIE